MAAATPVLNNEQIQQKINRIAHEIYENNFETQKIIIVGIAGQGYTLAERLTAILKTISPITIELVKISLNKDEPLSEKINLSVDIKTLENQTVVLVDDVLNSGKTLIYAAGHLLQVNMKKMNTTCLVDRRHRRYPIRADFVGLTLSTTVQEHIKVEFSKGNDSVFLI